MTDSNTQHTHFLVRLPHAYGRGRTRHEALRNALANYSGVQSICGGLRREFMYLFASENPIEIDQTGTVTGIEVEHIELDKRGWDELIYETVEHTMDAARCVANVIGQPEVFKWNDKKRDHWKVERDLEGLDDLTHNFLDIVDCF